jgi:hypothetical protein
LWEYPLAKPKIINFDNIIKDMDELDIVFTNEYGTIINFDNFIINIYINCFNMNEFNVSVKNNII